MSKRFLFFLPLACLSACFLFSGESFATRYNGSTVFNPPDSSSGLLPFARFHTHYRKCNNHSEDIWTMSFNNSNFNSEISTGYQNATATGCGSYQYANDAYYGDFVPDSPIGTKLDLTNLEPFDFYSLVVRGRTYLIPGTTDVAVNGTGLNYIRFYTQQNEEFRNGTFVIVPTNLTTFENDEDYDNGTVKKFNGALYYYANGWVKNGDRWSVGIDLSDFYTNSPLGSSEQDWADYFIAYVPGQNLYENPLTGSWGTDVEEWCAVNQENNPDCANQVMTKPGYDASDLDGQGFSIVNPFDILFGGFTSEDCVSVPTLASWVHSPTSTVCKWFNADVRQAGTTAFSFLACVILFGFIVHWLSKSGEMVL